MKKLLLSFAACIASFAGINTANAQLYVTGINGSWTMPAPLTVNANSEGNYVFTTKTEFKMSTTNGSNWDNDFNPNALVPATALNRNLQTQTVALKKDSGSNFSLPYGDGEVEFTITVTSDFSKVTVTGASAPTGEFQKLFLCGTNSSWSFSSAWQFKTDDGNLYYMEGKTLANNAEFKVAGNGWSPNYGDGGNQVINTQCTLVKGSNPANMKLAVGGSNLTISFNATTLAFLISNDGSMVSNSTETNPFANVWVNCRGGFNDWADNGVHPDNDGIATFASLPIGTTEFEIKVYETEDEYYGTSTPLTPGSWIQLTKGNDHMTISNAVENAAYEVQYNVSTNQIKLTPVSVTYPETIYILGEANGNSWAPDNGVEMTNDGNGIYTADNIELNGADGNGYFYFSENLDPSWNNLVRFGSATGSNTLAVLDTPMPLSSGEASFYAPNGTYNLKLNYATMKMTLSEAPQTPDAPQVVYVLQPFSGTPNPETDQQLPVTDQEGIYSGKVTLKKGMSYLGFYTVQGDTYTKYSRGGFGTIKFGTDFTEWPNTDSGEGDNNLKENPSGTQSWYIPSYPTGCNGEFIVTVNLNDMTLSLKAVVPTENPLPTTLYLMGLNDQNMVTVKQPMTQSTTNPAVFEITYNVPYIKGTPDLAETADDYVAPAFSFYFNTEGKVSSDKLKNYGAPQAHSMITFNTSKTVKQTWTQGMQQGGNGLDPLPGSTTFRFNVETYELELIYNDPMVMMTFQNGEDVSDAKSLLRIGTMDETIDDFYLYASSMPFGYNNSVCSGGYMIQANEGYILDVTCDQDATTNGRPNYVIYPLSAFDDLPTSYSGVMIGLYNANGFKFNVKVSVDPTTGVEKVDAAEGNVEYYNLQGVRIANPDHGIFIRVANGKVSKVVR